MRSQGSSNMYFHVDTGRFLGHGLYGEVYHAQLRHHPVAAKCATSVHKEAGFLILCSHENVVKCNGVLKFNGRPYLVMELAEFGDLRAELGYNKFSPTMMKLLVQQICRGLDHIHGRCVLHRDIIVENLLLKSFTPLHLVIADFGQAETFSESATHPNSHRIVRDSFYTLKSDIYLLALVVIQIFQDEAGNELSLRDRVMTAGQISHHRCVAPGSRCFQTIMDSLHDDPEVRPSAAEFAEAFIE